MRESEEENITTLVACTRLYNPLQAVGPSVHQLVRNTTFFGDFGVFCITAPAQMLG